MGSQKQEDKSKGGLGFIILLLLAIAIFLIMPGMVVVAIVVDCFALHLDPAQPWIFSAIVSPCVFLVLRIGAVNERVTSRRYLTLCGIITAVFVLFYFGFNAPFSERWLAIFVQPNVGPPQPTHLNGPAIGALDGIQNIGVPETIPKALPFSDSSPPLNPSLPGTSIAEVSEAFYNVGGIPRGDMLNVRNGPGANYDVTARLPDGFSNIRIVGEHVMNGATEWVQIAFGNNTGWVTNEYLKSK